MSIKLPREFLWQDYESMDEFLKEPINQDLYKVYLTVKDAPFKITIPDVKVFNELYYQCAKFSLGDISMEEITNSIEADLGFVYSKSLISSMMLAVNFTQKKRIDNYYEILFYLQDNRGWYFKTFTDFIDQRKSFYDTNLKPRPIDVETAATLVDSWFDATSYYSQRVITKIVNLWNYKEEKLFVLGFIEESFNMIIDKKRLLPKKGAINEDDTANASFFASIRRKIERSMKNPSNGKKYSKDNIRLVPQAPPVIHSSPQVTPLRSNDDNDKRTLPEEFNTREAEQLMEKIVNAGLLNNNWLPLNLSIAERGYLAHDIARRLLIKNKWKVMGALWNENPETLRQGMNRAIEQKKTGAFIEKLKKILD